MAIKKLLLAATLVAGVAAAKRKAAAVGDIEVEDGVLVLTADNFDAAIAAHDPMLVEFYAPWCGHCKKLTPEYAKAAKALAGEGVKLAKVDATEHKELSERFGVQGFPTLKWFKGGKASEYGGGREEKTIVSWIRKRIGAATTTVSTAAELAAFTAKNPVAAIAYVSAADSALAKAVGDAAQANDDVAYAISTSAELRTAAGVAADTLVAVNDFEGEENQIAYTGAADAAAIGNFVSSHSLPAVVLFTQESAPRIFRGPLRTHFLLFANAANESNIAATAAFRASALANRGTALYVRVDPAEERISQYFGVTEADMPTAVLVSMPEASAMKKFGWPKGAPLTTEAFDAHIAGWKAGSLKPTLKSEPVPDAAAEAAAAVKTVVGDSFADVVLDGSKDVLLEVYAPWCGHCKSLAPTWEKLGKAVQAAGAKDVVIAKMDGTANEVDYEGVNIKGFPTILFFPASKAGDSAPKVPIEYDGARDLAGFISYLGKKATHSAQLGGISADGADEEDGHDDEEL